MADDHVSPVPADPSADLAKRQPAAADESQTFTRRPVPPGTKEVHGFRFRMAYALLAIVLGAAVGGFIVLMGRGDSGSHAAWSNWEPEGSDFVKTRDISNFVGHQYRLPSGRQLVAVIPAVPPAVQGAQPVTITHIALAESSSPEDIQVFSTDNSVEYILCGVGSPSGRCAIGEGSATVQRARLLHRESLALALYTFKYVDGVDSVVTLQPPRAGTNPVYALFFRKDDFKDELDRPLAQTLRGNGPFSTEEFPVIQQAQIARLVSPHLFRFSYQQAPDGSAVMVLQPPAA